MEEEKIIPTPVEFCDEAKTMWQEIQAGWILGPDGLPILRVACLSLSRYLEAEGILDEEGLYFTTASGQKKKHPMVEVSKNERAGFLAAMRQIDLQGEPEPPKRIGRPPGPGKSAMKHYHRGTDTTILDRED